MIDLTIPERLLTEMQRHALHAYPEECCGILVGQRAAGGVSKSATVSQVIRGRNLHDGPRSRGFAIAPEDLLWAHKQAQQRGEDVIGYYHSHPDGEALPSKLDHRAADPGVSHLILAVRPGRVVCCRSWRLPTAGSRFEEERLV